MSSKGILIHAFGNAGIDYYLLANGAAKLAKRTFKLPVAVITDTPAAITEADHVIEATSEIQQQRTLRGLKYAWLNDTRVYSYELTPFDQTLLIDSDFLLFRNDNTLFDGHYDFIAPTHITYPGRVAQAARIYNGILQAWATTVYFRKGREAKAIFDYWKMAQENWDYYKKVLNTYGNYRNDYTLSLALHTMNGYSDKYFNKFSLTTIPTNYDIVDIDFDASRVVVVTPEGSKMITYTGSSVHIMNKVRLCEIFREKWVT